MKITRPSETIEVCDLCQSGGYLQKCLACGRSYCLTCHGGHVAGCVHELDICRECAKDKRVIEISRAFAPRIGKILKERDNALTDLRPASGEARE